MMVNYFDSISTIVVAIFAIGIVSVMVYERARLRLPNAKTDENEESSS